MSLLAQTQPSAFRRLCCLAVSVLIVLLTPRQSLPHGVAGNRFFPSTLAVDDPFASDEFSLLTSHIKELDGTSTEVSFDFAKRITPQFGIEIGDAVRIVKPNGEKTRTGFGNLEVGAKYQFLTSAAHEALLSVGLEAEIGGTGDRKVDADSYSTWSTTVLFGKGFGDLPDSAQYLKPFAVTGAFGVNFPTRANTVTVARDPATGDIDRDVENNPITFSWGFTLQYSLQYLQTYVKDVGLPTPLDRTILLVEFPFETCLGRGCAGEITGYVNPGIIWFGKYVQLGIEAQIPVNDKTGHNVGVLGLVHLFIDDLFPHSLGKPLIGR